MGLTKRELERVPAMLVASRFALGPLVCLAAACGVGSVWIAALLLAAMLSDIFDGVIARRLGVATERLRVADSRADAWFFMCIGIAAWLTVPDILRAFWVPLVIEVGLQAGSYLFDLARYGRIASLHAYSAKLWGFSLYMVAIGLLALHTGAFIWVAFALGIVSAVDAMAIKLMLPGWRHDVLSAFHARRMRQRESIS